jgi:hypothetical protein
MPANNTNHKRSMWISIAVPVVSLAIGVISTSFFIGGKSGKVSELVKWKDDIAPKVERALIERETYIKQLSAMDARIQRVEQDTAHFDVLETEHRRLTKDVEDLKDNRRRNNDPPKDDR